MADFIAAKLASAKAVDRAQKTLDATLALIQAANAADMVSIVAKYNKQAARQRDALALEKRVYDELNRCCAPSPQVELPIPPVVETPKRR